MTETILSYSTRRRVDEYTHNAIVGTLASSGFIALTASDFRILAKKSLLGILDNDAETRKSAERVVRKLKKKGTLVQYGFNHGRHTQWELADCRNLRIKQVAMQ